MSASSNADTGLPGGLVFDPGRAPATPRQAATVIVVREAPLGEGAASEPGVEVYCVARSPRSGFLGGAVVFPGGKVDDADADPRFDERLASPPHPRLLEVERDPAKARAIAVAAARECLEEAGIVCADAAAPALAEVRRALEAGATFLDSISAASLALDLGSLHPFAWWITPEAEPRRYDTKFFITRMRPGQEAAPCETETTSGLWASPAELLAKFERGEIQLAPPTTRCLELLRDARSATDAIGLAAQQRLAPICPQFIPQDPPALALPGDPAHREREAVVRGPTRFVLVDGRFVSRDP